MSSKPSAPLGPPPPTMDLSDYTEVTIVRADDVEGHTFRRGERATVDSATLAALRAKGMIDGDAKPAS